MLPWRLHDPSARLILLWAKLFIVTLTLHAVAFLWLFFLYQTVNLQFVCTSGLVPSFIPNKKIVSTTDVGLVTVKKPQLPAAQQAKKNTVVAQKSVASKPAKEQKPLVKKEPVKEKLVVPEKKVEKPAPKVPEKVPEKVVPKVAEKTAPLPEKTKQEPEIQKQEKKEEVASVNQKNEQKYISARERDEQHRIMLLQKEIGAQWRPPVGDFRDCSCKVTFVVLPSGAVGTVRITESSGVLLYDMSVRSALLSTTLPVWARGKTLTITFKQ